MAHDRADVARFGASRHRALEDLRLARRTHIRGFTMDAYLASHGALLARNEAMLAYLGCSLTDSDSLVEAEDRNYGIDVAYVAHVSLVNTDPFYRTEVK